MSSAHGPGRNMGHDAFGFFLISFIYFFAARCQHNETKTAESFSVVFVWFCSNCVSSLELKYKLNSSWQTWSQEATGHKFFFCLSHHRHHHRDTVMTWIWAQTVSLYKINHHVCSYSCSIMDKHQTSVGCSFWNMICVDFMTAVRYFVTGHFSLKHKWIHN